MPKKLSVICEKVVRVECGRVVHLRVGKNMVGGEEATKCGKYCWATPRYWRDYWDASKQTPGSSGHIVTMKRVYDYHDTSGWTFCKECFPNGGVITDLVPQEEEKVPPVPTWTWRVLPTGSHKHAMRGNWTYNFECGQRMGESLDVDDPKGPKWITDAIRAINFPACKKCERVVSNAINAHHRKAWKKLVKVA